MEKLIVLSSFLKGFKRSNPADVINGLFIAEKLFEVSSSFTFENRDNNGVDSPEIRRFLIFNIKELKNQEKTFNEFLDSGKKVSELDSNELKWAAQFIKNGKTHLFPEEAQKAKNLVKVLQSSPKV